MRDDLLRIGREYDVNQREHSNGFYSKNGAGATTADMIITTGDCGATLPGAAAPRFFREVLLLSKLLIFSTACERRAMSVQFRSGP